MLMVTYKKGKMVYPLMYTFTKYEEGPKKIWGV